ncbi:MAG: hypothetical protein NZ922_06750, partial [Candidatus Methanomethyliaceae archaeon]|nr:hypothetical protein [Candidatus Methanomethyliaceae archaeon]
MRIKIKGNEIHGVIKAPPSKSYTQRAIACALLAEGKTTIINPSECEDAKAALNAAKMLGAEIEKRGGKLIIKGGQV